MEVVLFDGVCNLCDASVNFIIDHDPRARFHFAALQSDAAVRLLGRTPAGDTVVLVRDARVYARSAAAVRIAAGLAWPWKLLALLWLAPKPLRDWGYDFVASHRYRWFGRRSECRVPTPELRARFL